MKHGVKVLSDGNLIGWVQSKGTSNLQRTVAMGCNPHLSIPASKHMLPHEDTDVT